MPPKLNKKAKWRFPEPPLTVQVQYYRDLMAYTRKVAAVFEAEVFPAIPDTGGPAVAADAEETPLDRAFKSFLKKAAALNKKAVEKGAMQMIEGVEVFQRKVFVENIKKAVGVDIESIVSQKQVVAEIKEAAKVNFDLIKTIKTDYAERGRAIIDAGLKTGKAQKDIVKDLMDLGGFRDQDKGIEQRRAKVIVRDQSQKFAKSIDTTRQKKVGITHFTWINSGDIRVRDDHDKWGNHYFSYADPPNGELPGDAVQCRCHAKPDTRGLLEALEKGELK
jgi:SPP1 gp7 family putative phage head morphogenesis protein